jgi:hypothetical protein
MVNEPAHPGFTDAAADSLTAAGHRVDGSEPVNDAVRYFEETIHEGGKPGSVLKFLEERTRAAPLAMLGLAFIAGAILVRRR